MARYFFDFHHNPTSMRDEVGTELPDDHAARVEGVETAANWIKDNASVAGVELTVLIRKGRKPLNAVTASIRVTSTLVSETKG